jgi:hypothetical protein
VLGRDWQSSPAAALDRSPARPVPPISAAVVVLRNQIKAAIEGVAVRGGKEHERVARTDVGGDTLKDTVEARQFCSKRSGIAYRESQWRKILGRCRLPAVSSLHRGSC